MTNRDYGGLTREELEQRCDAAEDVVVMNAWSPSRFDATDRDAAAYELWLRWEALPGTSSNRKDNAHLTDALVTDLAWRRQEIRGRMLNAIEESGLVEGVPRGGDA